MKRVVGFLVVVALLGFLGWRIWEKVQEKRAQEASQNSGGKRRGGVVPVVVDSVRRETIRDVRLFTGTLRPDSEFDLAPKISGRLKTLAVHMGEPVKHGQLIAELDSEEHARRLEEAQAALEVARANAEKVRLDAELEDQELSQKAVQVEAELGIAKANVTESVSNRTVAEREYERAKALRDKTIMSQSGLDEAEAQFLAARAREEVARAQVAEKEAALASAKVRLSDTQKSARHHELLLARAQVAQQEAAVKSAEVQLAYTRIVAEWEGDQGQRYVGKRYVDDGAMLTSSTPVVSVVDLAKLRALIYVIERDYPLIRVGQEAEVTTDAYPGKAFTGRIARISQVLQETSRQALVEVEIANEDMQLKPGMFVRLAIEFAKHENATVVPRAALVRYNDREGVFQLDETGKAVRFVPVQVGILNGTLAEVLDPPLDGSVVTLGHHLLSDGAEVVVSTFSGHASGTEE
jgi:RND family efflux transporter MFP subunit